jgi:hypothetical protein
MKPKILLEDGYQQSTRLQEKWRLIGQAMPCNSADAY